jgi:hypothetical protein
MKYSDVFFLLWMLIWSISSTVDFAFTLSDDKPVSIVVESKSGTTKEPEKIVTDDIPKPTW